MAFDSISAAVSGLNANSVALATTQHNIANVNTEGFSRQRAEFGSQIPQRLGNSFIGTGVQLQTVTRIFDALVLGQLQASTTTFREAETLLENAQQIDNVLANPNIGLNGGLNDFFTAVNGVSDDPSNFGARVTLFAEAESLVSRFNGLESHFDDLRLFVNGELRAFAADVNQLAQNVATLNEQLLTFPVGQQPADLLDQRDQVITRIAEQVAVTTVAQSDGSLNVFIGNGQGLVIGNTASTLAVQVSVEDAADLDVIISDGNSIAIVTSQIVGGVSGGLLQFRDNILNRAQNTIGQIAVGLAAQLNDQHRLGQDFNGNLGGDIFVEPTVNVNVNTTNVGGAVVTGVFGNTGNLTPSDFRLTANSATTFTLTRLDDGTTTAIDTLGASPFTAAEVDGFILTIDSTVAAAAGDSFLIQPTRNAANEIALALNSADDIASALPVRLQTATNANGLGTNTGNGLLSDLIVTDVTNLPLAGPPVNGSVAITFDAVLNQFNLVPDVLAEGPLAYDPSVDSGTSFTILGGLTFTATGTPDNGDSFILSDNTSGISDNGNALLLAGLQAVQTLNGGTSSFNTTDSQLVTTIGTLTRNASISEQATEALFFQAQERREAISGVNLDEEAANLVQFQQAFQANAQVIAISSQLFDTLLNAVG